MSSKFNFLKQDLTAMTQDKDFFCFDVETTGLSPSDNRIIQLSMIHGRFEGIKPIEIDRMNFYINPGKGHLPLPDKIVNLTGITTETVMNQGISEQEAVQRIQNFFGDHKINLTGWNVSFDCKFLTSLYARQLLEFEPNLVVDAMQIAKQRIPKTEIKNYKLVTVAENFHLDDGVSFHDSMEDTHVTFLIFNILSQELLEEKEDSEPLQLIKPIVYKMESWSHFYSQTSMIKRIYLDTSVGSIFYDQYKDEFGAKSKELDLDMVDSNYLMEFMLCFTHTTRIGVNSIQEWKGRIEFDS